MDDLVRWLGEQLDADQQLAEDARCDLDGRWTYVETQGGKHKVVDSLGYSVTEHYDVDAQPYFCEPHIAAHDPARVLREIDAKRRLLAIHRPYVPEPDQACLGCAGGIMFTSCPVVRLLALPYADRPGFREEWRP